MNKLQTKLDNHKKMIEEIKRETDNYNKAIKEFEEYKLKQNSEPAFIYSPIINKNTKPLPAIDTGNIIEMQKLAVNNYSTYQNLMNSKKERGKK
jgi:hypothetical protein